MDTTLLEAAGLAIIGTGCYIGWTGGQASPGGSLVIGGLAIGLGGVMVLRSEAVL